MERSIMDDDTSTTSSYENRPANIHVFASSSTLHGFSHIFARHHSSLRKFAWTVAFLTSLTLLLFQSSNRVVYYLEFPHVTRLDEITAINLSFPAVTICNLNEFRFSKITKNDIYHVGQLLGFLDQNDTPLEPSFYKDFDGMDYSVRERLMGQRMRIKELSDFSGDFTAKGDFNMFEFYNRTGHELSEYLLRCKYRGMPCFESNFSKVFTRYGKCYTFNSGKLYPPLTTLKGGVDNGLELLLDTQQNDYMPVWDETDEISVEAGFKVQIHVQSEPPFIHELGFGVSPGFQTLVATQEQRITFLPGPWGQCVKNFDKQMHFHFENYSISACRITCETRFVLENCSCRMVHMPGNGKYCDPEKYKKCADKALDYLVNKDEETCVCKTPCDVTRYNLEMSTLQLPSTQATSYLAWRYNVSERYVRDNFVKLNIFFEALNYETIEQKRAYEVPGLLGDIGGQMGLFIGASILTILELFDYVYEFIKDKTWGRNLRRARREAEQQASLAATTSLLVEKSEKDAVSNLVSPTAQYHAVPGTIAMSFPQRPNNFNGIHSAGSRHGAPVIATQPHHYINQTRSQPYNTMPYNRSATNYSSNPVTRPSPRYQDESLPPPPPQYLGQSMLTLRGDCGVPEMALTKRYSGRGMGDPRTRETSLSYNDLLHLGENDTNATEDDEEPEFHHRHNHIGYTSGLATLPHFSAPSHMFDNAPNTHANDYPSTFRMSAMERQNPRLHGYSGQGSTYTGPNALCMSPTKIDYSKTLETDIH